MSIYSILTAAAYLYFHWQYFKLVQNVEEIREKKQIFIIAAYFVNYILFFICSYLEFHLIFNWTLFFLFLTVETLIFNKASGMKDLFFSMTGILFGLAVNVFCRCMIAIVIHQPLSNFDNNTSRVGNLKAIPVLIGFLLAGLIFRMLDRDRFIGRIRTIRGYPQHLSFLLKIMLALLIYLYLTLLLYYAGLNYFLLKLWGIKSSAFVIAAYYLGVRYTLRMCKITDYRRRNREMEAELLEKKQEEENMRLQAYQDVLTGFYNRKYALDTVSGMLDKKEPFILCFIDVDGLKHVNDILGHIRGDKYIIEIAEVLRRECGRRNGCIFRYGGDEFIVLFQDEPIELIRERMQSVNSQLRKRELTDEFPFAMSVSYGIAAYTEAVDGEKLIHLADQRMYEQKKQKKRTRI